MFKFVVTFRRFMLCTIPSLGNGHLLNALRRGCSFSMDIFEYVLRRDWQFMATFDYACYVLWSDPYDQRKSLTTVHFWVTKRKQSRLAIFNFSTFKFEKWTDWIQFSCFSNYKLKLRFSCLILLKTKWTEGIRVRVVFVHFIFIPNWKLKFKNSQSWVSMFDSSKTENHKFTISIFNVLRNQKLKIENGQLVFISCF